MNVLPAAIATAIAIMLPVVCYSVYSCKCVRKQKKVT
jgi:Na+-driven multidrug efflux pump